MLAMAEFTTLQEMLLIAHGKVEPAVWDFINGGTESEVTLRRNRHGLDRLAFRPRVLSDVARIDTWRPWIRMSASMIQARRRRSRHRWGTGHASAWSRLYGRRHRSQRRTHRTAAESPAHLIGP